MFNFLTRYFISPRQKWLASVNPRRCITYLKREYPIRIPQYVKLNGGDQQLTLENQIYVEGEREPEAPIIEVVLLNGVPGLGGKGSLIKVHRNRFWNNLYLRKLAALPTKELIEQIHCQDTRVLCGHAYEAQQRLLNMNLYIPMNPLLNWTLTSTHVKVAFRRLGIVVREEDITLPKTSLTSSVLEEFIVHVNLCGMATVPVKSRIFLYQRLDAKTATKPPANAFRKIRLDDWSADFEEEELRLLPGCTNRPYRWSSKGLAWRGCHRFSSSEAKARLQTLYCLQSTRPSSRECEKHLLTPSNRVALGHFDKYYAHIYGLTTWSSVRAALLTPSSKCLVLNSLNAEFQRLSSANQYVDLYYALTSPNAHSCDPTRLPMPQKAAPEAAGSSARHFLVREGLPEKLLSEFVPPTELISERAIYTRKSDRDYSVRGESDYGSVERSDVLSVLDEGEDGEIECVESIRNLRCFAVRQGVVGDRRRPEFTGKCFDFYPLDLASVLSILFLNVQPDTRMLDLCAAPGGKAITALQTLNISQIVCTDVSPARLERLRNVLYSFGPGIGVGRSGLPDVHIALIQTMSKKRWKDLEMFDRVLVDVPCSTDRSALTSSKGSVFSRGKVKMRTNLPITQKSLLLQAMSVCKVGGYVVYSTCTLSTAQNQAVIEGVLGSQGDFPNKAKFVIVSPSRLIRRCAATLTPTIGIRLLPVYAEVVPTSSTGPSEPIGAIVMPRIAANYGPTFICKLKRIE